MVGSVASKMDCGWMCVPAEKWSVIYGHRNNAKMWSYSYESPEMQIEFFSHLKETQALDWQIAMAIKVVVTGP